MSDQVSVIPEVPWYGFLATVFGGKPKGVIRTLADGTKWYVSNADLVEEAKQAAQEAKRLAKEAHEKAIADAAYADGVGAKGSRMTTALNTLFPALEGQVNAKALAAKEKRLKVLNRIDELKLTLAQQEEILALTAELGSEVGKDRATLDQF